MQAQPVEQATLALREVIELVRLMLGEDIGRRVEALFADQSRFMAAPATFQAELEDLFSEGSQQLEPTPENIQRFFKVGVALERLKQLTRSEDEQGTSVSEAGTQTLAFLQTSRFALDVTTYRRAIIEIEEFDISGFVHPSLASIQNLNGELPFEAVARQVSDALRRLAENWYRPMLAAMFRLTQARTGDNSPVQHELGNLMTQCRGVWRARGGPLAVLSDMIRVVRNSESHGNTEIDVRAETIAFINRPRPPQPEQRHGPLNRDGFGHLARQILEHCLSMWKAFAAIDISD